MVEVIYRPIRRIVIMECIKYSTVEELLQNLMLAPGQPIILYWAEGVLFIPVPAPITSEFFSRELADGNVYWLSVSFTEMNEYSPKISAEKCPEANVINVSKSPSLSIVARWLKSFAPLKEY